MCSHGKKQAVEIVKVLIGLYQTTMEISCCLMIRLWFEFLLYNQILVALQLAFRFAPYRRVNCDFRRWVLLFWICRVERPKWKKELHQMSRVKLLYCRFFHYTMIVYHLSILSIGRLSKYRALREPFWCRNSSFRTWFENRKIYYLSINVISNIDVHIQTKRWESENGTRAQLPRIYGS